MRGDLQFISLPQALSPKPESVIVGLHTINRARQTIAVCLALNFFMKPYPSAVPFLLFSSFRQQDAHQNTQESRDHPAQANGGQRDRVQKRDRDSQIL